MEDALFICEADVASEASLSQIVVVHFIVIVVAVLDAIGLPISRG